MRILHFIGNRSSASEEIRGRKGEYFLFYTILFLLVSAVVFSWYILSGRTLIWKMDGWTQHYKALICYARYLRSIVYGIFDHHRLEIPTWDFSIGEGSDILGALHYYVIGDPFAVLSVFVPTRYMYLYYNMMILLRLYFAGIAFSCLCFGTGHRSKYAVLAGSMMYVFCYWGVMNAARHPYFLNPMIYLPMMILGIEKLLRRKKPYLFIVTVFLSAVSNFYFFYTLVLVTVIYVAVRIVSSYRKKWKEGLLNLLRIGAASVVGVLMAAVIFLPVCYIFLNDARMSASGAVPLLYPGAYYRKLFSLFLTDGYPYWMCMGFSAPILPAVFLLFLKKKNGFLKTLFVICMIIMTIPFLGHALNGFSYVANRWCWAFALAAAYIMTSMWPHLMNIKKKEGILLSLCMAAYFLICLVFEESRTVKAFTAIFIASVFLLVVLFFQDRKGLNLKSWQQPVALCLLLTSIFYISFWANSADGGNYVSECMKAENLYRQLTENETAAVRDAADLDGTDAFYRFSGRNLTRNAGPLAGISSTQYYWTLSNPYTFEARSALDLREVSTFEYFGYDDRTALTALAAVRYYVVPGSGSSHLPYGYTQVEMGKKQSGYTVYRNDYALPLAYTYDSRISAGTWEKLSAIEKQEALLQGAVVDGYDGAVKETDPRLTSSGVDYTVEYNNGHVAMRDHSFVVTKARSTVTLKFKGLPDCETYLSVKGLDFKGKLEKGAVQDEALVKTIPTRASLAMRASTGAKKSLVYYTKDCRNYNGRHDFLVDFCYSEEPVTSIRIAFSKEGTYSFDSLQVLCQPMEHYAGEINERKEKALENMEISADRVVGSISLTEPELLCFAIPYSAGWNAYVDGKKAKLYRANTMYMALDLDAGRHSVTLVYRTPLLKAGAGISFIAFVLFGLCLEKRKRWLENF